MLFCHPSSSVSKKLTKLAFWPAKNMGCDFHVCGFVTSPWNKFLHTGDTEYLNVCWYQIEQKRTETHIKERKEEGKSVRWQVAGVTCDVSYAMFDMSPVTCHLSLTAIARATPPPPANSPTMHSRLVRNHPKTWEKKSKCKKSLKQHEPKKHLEVCQ